MADHALAFRLDRIDFFNPGRRTGNPKCPDAGAQIRRRHHLDGFLLGRFQVFGRATNRFAQSLCGAQYCRERTFERFKSIVEFARRREHFSILRNLEIGYAHRLRHVKHLGEHRRHLRRLGIGRVLAAENQVEADFLARQRERARGCQRVRAGKLASEQMHRAIRAHRQRFRERVFGLRWSHRDDDDLPAELLPQVNRFGDCAFIEWIDLALDAIANDAHRRGIEFQLVYVWNLLDADDYFHIAPILYWKCHIPNSDEPKPNRIFSTKVTKEHEDFSAFPS